MGANVSLNAHTPAPEHEQDPSDTLARLFGEGPGGFVVSGPGEALTGLAAQAPLRMLGTVGGDGLTIATDAGVLSATLSELAEAHAALAELFP